MERNKYIDSNIAVLMHNWTNIATLAGSFVIVALCLLDFLVTPENFKTFLIYRLIASAIIFILYLINRKGVNKTKHLIVGLSAGIVVSVMVAAMIQKFSGHQSPYFAGIILVLFFVVGLTSLDVKMSIVNSFIIYAIYLIPILIFDTISNKPFFINANAFILATIFATVLLRYLIQQRFVSEFGLQYDIEQQKEQLKLYSTQLEVLVQERTKELAISEKWHRSIFNNATDGIIVLDRTGKIVNVNRMTCELHSFNREALIGVNIELLEAQDGREKLEERMSLILNGESLIYETEHYKKDGSKVVLEVSSKALDIGGETYVQSFYRDITEKRKIQEQLMHSQKMESVGALAGGIAHNFNNILTSILGYSELLLEFSDLADAAKQRVRNIESAARKAGVMVSKLLSFARRDSHEVLPLNLHDVINDSAKLLEGVLDKRIGLKVILSDLMSPVIEGDPNQLEQVIMNLMVNARDAMPEGGLITIQTSFTEIEEDRLKTNAYIKPGQYIALKVSDTGHGIPRDIIEKIFDPFFTTKEKGKGTGLGLATVYGIVKDHKGYISVQSEVGKGTIFDIYLPVSRKVVHQILRPQIHTTEGHENILLVDDDKDVLNLIRDILETYGYTVLPVNNSLTAVDIFKKQANSIQLVITDIMMPLMEGNELIKSIKQIKPEVKIIAVSGYTDNAVNQKDWMIDAFIKKPFEKIEMLSTVRRLLDTGIRNLPLY
jgi:two-component system, cell cycle sensor histidine kinase and response regulator CckA